MGREDMVREEFQVTVRPWQAERLMVLINRSRHKGVELWEVSAQLELLIEEHHNDLKAAYPGCTIEEAAERWRQGRIVKILSPPPGWRKPRLRTIDGGKKDEKKED
jgi:hypothetical protein